MVNKSSTGKDRLSDLLDTKNPEHVFDELKIVISMVFPEFDFIPMERVFLDIVKLFNGKYPGYKECNTPYHDLNHTLDALVAITRLIHGYTIGKEKLSEKNVFLSLVSALMHDTGYIQTQDDNSGTGAKYTLKHISRSILFMEKYFNENSFSKEDTKFCRKCILCTNINTRMDEIKFSSHEEVEIGKMLGISDLLSQMADRNYLEKLILLYIEFKEGGIKSFESEVDLLNKTIVFFDMTKKRFIDEMGNLDRYMIFHFKARWNIERDLYLETIEKNMDYLKHIMGSNKTAYYEHLKRDGILDKLKDNYYLKG